MLICIPALAAGLDLTLENGLITTVMSSALRKTLAVVKCKFASFGRTAEDSSPPSQEPSEQ